jgi:uncharacterized protein YjaZ
MGIIETNHWLREEFDKPLHLCEHLIPYFNDQGPREIYHQLTRFGMFKPSRLTWETYQNMEKDKVWQKVGKIYEYYCEKWSGPKIPVFLFPIDQAGGLFRRSVKKKSGVSFPDKMFLFLSDFEDPKELEALFVHEYHHVCRLNKLKKKLGEYTLLDSMIIEGLAEYAVLKHCGQKFLAEWCGMYTEREMNAFWDRFLKDQLTTRKREKVHDDLLYGNGRFPRLLGYAAGFSIVQQYYQKHPYSTKGSFSIPAEQFLKKIKWS